MGWNDIGAEVGQAALGAMAEAIIVVDPDEIILGINQIGLDFLGYADDKTLIGEGVGKLFGEQELITLVGLRESLTDGIVRELNAGFLMKDGTEKPGTLSAAIFNNAHGAEEGIVIVARDENTLQQDLAQSSRWAADEKEKADSLAIARDALAKANQEIKNTHAQLMVASRQAGMAEIASGVLHNVGNVLNAVNISGQMIVDNLRRSKISGFLRSTELLTQHQNNMVEFIRDDPKGAKLISYLILLAQQLKAELKTNLEEAEALQQKVDHIKTIISSQQEFAKRTGVNEKIILGDLLEHALGMQESLFLQNGIEVVRDYGDIAPFLADKHKILQIVINILSNAKHALLNTKIDQKPKLIIRARLRETDVLSVNFIDNGVGIEPAHLKRIFNHGFTTKRDGHGFGLHSCANAAKEMGGKLFATSEGHGTGATFTLELPYQMDVPIGSEPAAPRAEA